MRRIRIGLLLCCGLFLLSLSPAAAFQNFFAFLPDIRPEAEMVPDTSPLGANDAAAMGLCMAAIKAAERRYNIPQDLLVAIGLQESGAWRNKRLTVWPWTVNAAGEGRRFETRAEAAAFVRAKLASGVSLIDVGCMQINLRWHPAAFPTPEAGFDPVANVDYAARFLVDLYQRKGNWLLAAESYHASDPTAQARYRVGIIRNLAVAAQQHDAFITLAAAGIENAGQTLDAGLSRNLDFYTSGKGSESGRLEKRTIGFSRSLRPITPIEDTVPNTKPNTTPDTPTDVDAGPWWTASLSSADAEKVARSIYSDQPLQPVLPNFIATDNEDAAPVRPSEEKTP